MADPVTPTAAQRRGETDRVKAFSDGVFAIIITILVLEIGVPPDLPSQSVGEAIDDTLPQLVAWAISFLLTGAYWVWHRDLFNVVRSVDRSAVWLNLFFLLSAALIPFAASVLSEYPRDQAALGAYGAVMAAVSLTRWVLFAYVARRPDLLWKDMPPRRRQVGSLLALAPIAVYIPAMLLAGVAPYASLALYFLTPLLYSLFTSVLRRHPTTREEAEDFG